MVQQFITATETTVQACVTVEKQILKFYPSTEPSTATVQVANVQLYSKKHCISI